MLCFLPASKCICCALIHCETSNEIGRDVIVCTREYGCMMVCAVFECKCEWRERLYMSIIISPIFFFFVNFISCRKSTRIFIHCRCGAQSISFQNQICSKYNFWHLTKQNGVYACVCLCVVKVKNCEISLVWGSIEFGEKLQTVYQHNTTCVYANQFGQMIHLQLTNHNLLSG